MITVKIGEAFVELVTDGKKLTAGLNDAEKQVIASTNAMATKFKAIGTIMTTVGGAITAAFTAIIYKTVQAGDELNDMSLRTGVAVETLSALAYAAKQSGTDIEGLELGIKFLTKGMQDASKGTGLAKDSFMELGISIKDSEGNLRPTIEVFKEAATKIAAIENPAKQSALAMELFGARSGTQLVPLLKLGGAGIDELMKKAEELGIVISTKDAQAADEFKDAMGRLTLVLGAAGKDIANILIPPLKDFIEKATEIIKKIRDWADAHKPLVEMIVKIGATLGALAAVGGPILLAASAFLKMKASILAVSLASKTELVPSLNTLGAKLISFGATSGPIGIMTASIIALGIAWKLNLFGMKDDWDKTIKYIQDTSVKLLDGMKSMVSGLKDTLGGGGGAVGAFADKIGKLEAVVNEWGEEIETTEEWIARLAEGAKTLAEATEEVKDKILNLTDPMEYQIRLLDREAEALREAGVEESLLIDWLEKAKNKLIEDSEATKTAISLKEKLANMTKSLTNKIFEFTHTDEEVKLRDINREYDLLIENSKEVFTDYNELRKAIAAINTKRQEEIDKLKEIGKEKDKDKDKNKDLGKSYDDLAKDMDKTTTSARSLYEQLMANGSIMDMMSVTLERIHKIAGSQAGTIAGSQSQNIAGSNPIIATYASGTSYVPKTGLALIHQGEKITPAGQNTTNNSSYSPSIVVNVSGNGNASEIKRAVEQALKESSRQFLRKGSELAFGI